ncbi:MAG: hypothetical protein QM766_01735 [Burkholderiaceae bacterium]
MISAPPATSHANSSVASASGRTPAWRIACTRVDAPSAAIAVARSTAINELERLLSLRLFDRVGRRLSLNGNGQALLPRAPALLDEAAALARVVLDADAQAASVRVGASTTIGNYALPALWARYLEPAIATGRPWQSRVMIADTAAVYGAAMR